MSKFTKFSDIDFQNEPSTATPLSAGNLNNIQESLQSALNGVFGSSATTYEENANTMYKDGIYNITEGGTTHNIPFTITSTYAKGVLIVLSKPVSDTIQTYEKVTQIAIDNQTQDIWIRSGVWQGNLASIRFGGTGNYNWKKIENILPITTDGAISKTNIKVGDKFVYVKRVSTGSLPNASSSTIPLGITDNITPYKIEGFASYSNGLGLPLPFVSIIQTNSVSINYDGSQKTITITTGSNRSGATGYIDFYFTYDN